MNDPAKSMRDPAVHLRLGTRQSPLAMAQALEARARLCAAHGWPLEAVELVPVVASGDKIQDRALAEIGGKALWTKELDGWLYEGRIDAAVHSMKDVETIRPDWLTLAAILPRADIRDCLIGAGSIAQLPQGAIVGTSAPRRAAQLLHYRPDCQVKLFRGNVATRLAKLEAGEADATFLAAAGLIRLEHPLVDGMAEAAEVAEVDQANRLDHREGQPRDNAQQRAPAGGFSAHMLEPDRWLPAAAQGAIGLECRRDDIAARKVLAAIDDPAGRASVLAERAVLAGLGGTCQSPVAMRSEMAGDQLKLSASLFSEGGAERVDGEVTLSLADCATEEAAWENSAEEKCAGAMAPARLFGEELLADAPSSIRVLFAGAAR